MTVGISRHLGKAERGFLLRRDGVLPCFHHAERLQCAGMG
jgi:hypothetical protein